MKPFRVKDIAILSLAQIMNTGLGFLLLPFLARTFKLTDFGTYSQVLTVSGLLTTFFGFGLATVVIPRMVSQQDEEGRSIVFSSVIALGIFGGAVCSFVMIVLARPIAHFLNNEALVGMLPLFALSPVLTILIGIFNSGLVVASRIKVLSGITLVSSLLKYALLFLAIKWFNSLAFVFVFLTIGDVLVLLLHLRYNSARLRIRALNWPASKSILQNGLALSSTVILGALILNLDSLIVAHLLSTEQFAIYKNGAIEVPFFATLYASITAILFPHISKLIAEGKDDDVIQLKRKILLYTAAFVYPVLVFLLFNSKDIILIYLSDRYALSASVFWIFNLTLLIRINDYADILIARNKAKYILMINLVCLAFNLPLNYFLVRKMGIQGAALCTVLTVFAVATLQVIKTNSILHQSVFSLPVIGKLLTILIISSMASLTSQWVMALWQLNPIIILIMKLAWVTMISLLLLHFTHILDPRIIFSLFKSSIKRK